MAGNFSLPMWKYLLDAEMLVLGDLPGPPTCVQDWQPECRCHIPPREVWTGALCSPRASLPLCGRCLCCRAYVVLGWMAWSKRSL